MRTPPNNNMWNLWNAGGPFIGDDGAPHGRVTVEIGWELGTSSATTFSDGYNSGPIRYFQLSDNSQTETEVQNVKSIDIDRTIDVDAATCRIVINNIRMEDNTSIASLANPPPTAGESVGQPGYFWPFRGDNANELLRWGWYANAWNDVLQPNALLRVYQGYGGRTKTISQALIDGNIIQTGIFLVDEVTQDAATGVLTISCRDMAKLLIEQNLCPPLVPLHGDAHYPLRYKRFVYKNHPVIPYWSTVYNTGFTPLTYDEAVVAESASSSSSGHGPAAAVDGDDPTTFWLSAGTLASTDTEWVQYLTPGTDPISGINIQPYGGNYEVYVSVMVGGAWQTATHPSGDPATVPGSSPPINYVTKVGVGWEQPANTIDLGAEFDAGRIRLTFTRLAKLGAGPAFYKAGIRNLQVGTFATQVSGGDRAIMGMGRGHNDTPNGYWLAGTDGGVFSFGDVKFYGSQANKTITGTIVGLASNSGTGKGYRLVGSDGGVYCFGDCYFHGSIPGLVANGTIPTPLNETTRKAVDITNGDAGSSGYYILLNTGEVYAFNCTPHGNHTVATPSPPLYAGATAIAAIAGGYYTVDWTGNVQAHGSATPRGSVGSPDGLIIGIETTSDGGGYWCVSTTGAVYAFGNATDCGGVNGTTLAAPITDIVRAPTGTQPNHGYWLVGADGGVFVPQGGPGGVNNAKFLGSLPQQYSFVGNGNYLDYLDIVKDLLLWSGWWKRNPANLPGAANVFGNLEETGVFAPDDLTEDFFDRKPVIDVINALREIVGYITYVDEIGAFHFHTPNVWTIGNFLETGHPARPAAFGGDPDDLPVGATPSMAVIDEKKQIIAYQVTVNDTDARSQITISTDDPALFIPGVQSVTIDSQWGSDLLRGIVRPALWVNGKFITETIQRTMAELIDLHLFMQQRQGTLTMPANPVIQIDDQVQIFERTTSEVFIHYVRGYNTHMDLESGEFTQTLQTHWLGDGTAWFLIY